MSIRLATAALIAGVLFLPPMASGQEATDAAQPAVPETDMQFAQAAVASGKAEVELAQLGVDKAASQEVKQFAQRLVDDHTKANDQLMQIVQSKGIELPAEPSAEAMAEKERIAGAPDGVFDREFITHFVSSHEKGVETYAKQAESGQDAELKQFAEQTLPTLHEHLGEAKRIEIGLQQIAGGETPEQAEPAAGTATAEGTAEQPAAPETTTAEGTAEQPAASETTTADGTAEQPAAPETTATETVDPAATQEAARPTYALGDMTADELIGKTVVNQNGEDVGEISDIVLNAADKAVLAVLSVGGFLGIGEKDVAVPFDQLEPGDNEAILMSSATEEDLKSMPEYQADEAGFESYPRDRPIGEGIQ